MPKWTPDEEQYLRDNHASMRDADMAIALNRSMTSVAKKRQALGCVKEQTHPAGEPPQESAPPEQVSDWERQIVRLKDELADLKKRHKFETRRGAALDAITEAIAESMPDVAWTTKRVSVKKRPVRFSGREQAVSVISDLHIGARVDPREVIVNAYDLDIAQRRLDAVIDTEIAIAQDKIGAKIFNAWMLGDIVSGMIHDELEVTNEITIMEQVNTATDMLQVQLQKLADEFETVNVVCLSGNHGRTKQKPYIAQHSVNNYDWMVAQSLERGLTNRPNIHFNIPRSPWTIINVAGTRFVVRHGHKKGSGNSLGIPAYGLTRDAFQRKVLLIEEDIKWDHAVIGHYHQFGVIPVAGRTKVIMNGSLIGPDAFADSITAGGAPSQTLFGVHPEYGLTEIRDIRVGHIPDLGKITFAGDDQNVA